MPLFSQGMLQYWYSKIRNHQLITLGLIENTATFGCAEDVELRMGWVTSIYAMKFR